MRNLSIPDTVESYQAEIAARAFPDRRIAENDFYRRMIGWVIDHNTPLLYEQSHPDEYDNLSINFNWLLLRDYRETTLGDPETILTLFALHEVAHMTHWLPTRLNEISADEYADQFTRSEYRASNESEILAYYRVPELRNLVFRGVVLAADILKQHGVAQPGITLLDKARALLIEHDDFDTQVPASPEAAAELARIKQFTGNRAWARQRFARLKPYFSDPSLPLGSGLTDTEYEATIAAYEPNLTQEQYEANVIRNVRLAYGMCGLPIPFIKSFAEAREAAKALENIDATA